MNLLIIGNISTGKTSLAKSLISSKFCIEKNYHSIDNIRTEYSDGSFAGEFFAWSNMLEAIQHPAPIGNSIYEFSGTGKNAWFVREAMKCSMEDHKSEWLVIYCLSDRSVLLERLKGREYNVPLPYKGLTPESSLRYMTEELQKKYGSGYWNSKEITIRTDQKTPEQCALEVIRTIET